MNLPNGEVVLSEPGHSDTLCLLRLVEQGCGLSRSWQRLPEHSAAPSV